MKEYNFSQLTFYIDDNNKRMSLEKACEDLRDNFEFFGRGNFLFFKKGSYQIQPVGDSIIRAVHQKKRLKWKNFECGKEYN